MLGIIDTDGFEQDNRVYAGVYPYLQGAKFKDKRNKKIWKRKSSSRAK